MSDPAVPARLFVALPLPARVTRLLTAMQPRAREGVRPVPGSDMHVTLHFLGRASILPVRQALASVGAAPFPIRLGEPGLVSLRGGKQILWIGVEPDERLLRLHAKTAEALRAVELEPEKRPYRPHVTLARVSSKARAASVDAMAPGSLPRDGIEFECRAFALFSSRTLAEGAQYELIESFPLVAGE